MTKKETLLNVAGDPQSLEQPFITLQGLIKL